MHTAPSLAKATGGTMRHKRRKTELSSWVQRYCFFYYYQPSFKEIIVICATIHADFIQHS